MGPRLLGSIVLATFALSSTGCPSDPEPDGIDSGRHDSGTCNAVDVGPSAPDGDEPEDVADTSDTSDSSGEDTHQAGFDAGGDTTAAEDTRDATIDSASDTSLDSTIDSAPDSTLDSTLDSTPDASSDVLAETDAEGDAGETAGFTPREFDAGAPVPRSAIDAIVNLSCTFTTCHGRAPQGVGGLFIPKPGKGDWYPNLVGVSSVENPTMPYVSPGDPAGSWLAHKVVGDQCLFTSKCKDHDCGDQMPQANEPLDDGDIRAILDWIRQGAKPE